MRGMLVDVICLRHNGTKRPADELRAATPIRGYLTVDTISQGPVQARIGRLPTELARLWRSDLGDASTPLVALDCARVTRVGGDALLVVGVEKTAESPNGRPQAWWCWVVLSREQAQARGQLLPESMPQDFR